MAALVKRWMPLVAFLFTLGTALAGLWMKAALAGTDVRLAKVEVHQENSDRRQDELRQDLRSANDKLDRILERLSGGRR